VNKVKSKDQKKIS